MKRIIVSMMSCIIITYACGMELIEQKVKTFTLQTVPPIVVIHDDIFDRKTQNVDITVIGGSEQLQLKNTTVSYCSEIGSVSYILPQMKMEMKIIKRKNKVFTQCFDPSYGFRDDSAAIIVEGERFIIKNPFEHVEEITMNNKVAIVKEPHIFVTESKDGKLNYHYRITYSDGKHTQVQERDYFGSDACEQAYKDLERCYKAKLVICGCFSKENSIRLAFPPLSISLGIPLYAATRIAVQSVVDFINENSDKDKYTEIQFVVPRSEDFDTYKSVLSEYKIDSTGKISNH